MLLGAVDPVRQQERGATVGARGEKDSLGSMRKLAKHAAKQDTMLLLLKDRVWVTDQDRRGVDTEQAVRDYAREVGVAREELRKDEVA